MSVASYVFGILCAAVLLLVVIDRLRRRQLRERHAVWWFVGALVALLAGVFPGVIQGAADALGFVVPANLLFFVSFAILFFVAIQHASELTALEAQTRALAERVAILEMEMRDNKPEPDASGDPTVSHGDGG